MRERRKKEKKSHNVSKTDKSVSERKKVSRGKRMTSEERSAQVDRQIIIILLLVITVIGGTIAAIFIYRNKIGEKGCDEQTDRCENGEYVGEREIDIKELSHVEMGEDELPEFNLYKETREMSEPDRFEFYKNEVKDRIYPVNVKSSDVLESLSEDEQNQWNVLYGKIAAEESKKGNTENVAELQILSSTEYREIYTLCYLAYCMLPQGDTATRYARNAGDALKVGLEEGSDYSRLITDFNSSNEGYVTSFHYRDCEQKRADGCYWAGDNFYQFLYHYSELTEEEKEHCALMAYFYAFFGSEVSGEEGVQHRSDLKLLQEATRGILIEEYDYPVFLFSEG